MTKMKLNRFITFNEYEVVVKNDEEKYKDTFIIISKRMGFNTDS